MKKAIILLLACALILSCAAAFAAATPWNDKTVNVKITNSVTGEDTIYDQSAAFAPGIGWSGNLDWSLKNNQLVAAKKADAASGAETGLTQSFANYAANDTGADGYGFYVKNNCKGEVLFSFQGTWIAPPSDIANGTISNSGIMFTNGSEAVLTSMDGVETAIKAEGVLDNGCAAIIIPEGFEGYVTIPASSIIVDIADDNAEYAGLDNKPLDNTKITLNWVALYMNNVDTNGIIFDNFFVYGSDITASEDASIVTDAITLKQDGQDGEEDDNKDNQQGTGDLSVLAYAAAAAAGCGTLIFRKKK